MAGGMAWAVALPAAAVMGFAIQRGATCTVAAVGDVVHRRRWERSIALAEASLWVAALILAARAAGLSMALAPAFALTAATVAGGILLGLGAVVTGACVFGAIARLSSGDWAFAATPVGFYLGCVAMTRWLPPGPAMRRSGEPALLEAPAWLTLLVIAIALWRLSRHLTRPATAPRASRWHRRVAHAWTPYAATLVIGIAFVVMLLAAGPWAYTDALAELARGTTSMAGFRFALFAALLGGAIAGGWSAGLLGHRPVKVRAVARCLCGGALMAAGSLMIPGSNDGLILLGVPLLQPYALIALAAMVATVAACLLLTRDRQPSGPAANPARSIA